MLERALLVGITGFFPGEARRNLQASKASLAELSRLVETAGGAVVGTFSQEIRRPQPATFIRKGKVEEIRNLILKDSIDTVAFDCDLTPAQNRNLESALGVKVIDRTAVILDIFGRRAKSKEGRLQVELAQLEYIRPRLKGMWQHFSQQAGGIGTSGPGETQLEIDKRRIREKISRIRRELKTVLQHRVLQRARRLAIPVPVISLIGYTNAGKSTLLNGLTRAKVLVEDKLFATLDPTIKRLKLPTGSEALVADTVGFIRNLPHPLVEAFKATFEEIAFADLLIHVIDASDPHAAQHCQVVEDILEELALDQKPLLRVFNKVDLVPGRPAYPVKGLTGSEEGIFISALTGEGLEDFLKKVEAKIRKSLHRIFLKLPYEKGGLIDQIYRQGQVIRIKHEADGIQVEAFVPEQLKKRLEA